MGLLVVVNGVVGGITWHIVFGTGACVCVCVCVCVCDRVAMCERGGQGVHAHPRAVVQRINPRHPAIDELLGQIND